MNDRIKKLTEEATKLSPEERAELVEGILASLDQPAPEILQAWADVCERRLDAYLSGETTAKNADDILAKYVKP